MRDFAAGVNYGASDPRKNGEALQEPGFGKGTWGRRISPALLPCFRCYLRIFKFFHPA